MVLRGYTRMTRKGQITVPAEVRKALGLKQGDRVSVRMDEASGQATIERSESLVDATFGALKTERRFTPDEERAPAREKRAEHLTRKHSPDAS